MQQNYEKYFQCLHYVVGEIYVFPIANISLSQKIKARNLTECKGELLTTIKLLC